jgi:hypothetical protein
VAKRRKNRRQKALHTVSLSGNAPYTDFAGYPAFRLAEYPVQAGYPMQAGYRISGRISTQH